MSDNIIFIVVAAIIAAAIVGVATYQLARYLRGSIKLSVPGTTFNPGESIVGSFELQTKKPIQGKRLTVGLVGVEVTRSRENGKTRTRSREVFRDEVLVEDAREYSAGYTADHTFELSIPDARAPEFLNSQAGKALTTALRMFGNRQTYLKWRVEARLAAKGVDLAASRTVSINTL